MFFSKFNNPPFKTLNDISGLQVTIMGLGLHGGGISSAKFFAKHGAKLIITDTKNEKELEKSIKELKDFSNIKYTLGKHKIEDFKNADVVIKNPGVKLKDNKYLAVAKSIETDLSVFLRFNKTPIIAVTGSKGKSTIVSAIDFSLKKMGYTSYLGGNITISPLNFLEKTMQPNPKTFVVLELSSWQLADLENRGLLKPMVACISPIMSDHQNWYGNMVDYVEDKKLIYKDLEKNSYLLCNADDSWGEIFAKETKSNLCWYSTNKTLKNSPAAMLNKKKLGFMNFAPSKTNHPFYNDKIKILPTKLSVPGEHNRQNLLIAAASLVLCGCSASSVRSSLAQFPGINHRLEFFYKHKGISFYNDSAATIPDASLLAIKSFNSPVILLCGGTDKELDFARFAKNANLAKKILLLDGSGTKKLIPLLKKNKVNFYGPFNNLKDLVTKAINLASPKDNIVFSPGAASFEMFKNEFDRGNKFKSIVLEILEKSI